MFTAEDTTLIIIDIQEKLFRIMHEKDDLSANTLKLVKGIRVLEIPIIVTEQNPAGLGPTIPELSSLLLDIKPITKFDFSCCNEEIFLRKLDELKRNQVILCGIETHICVYQTAIDLSDMGYEVQVVTDCVSSRTPANRDTALTRMELEGVMPTSTEMVLFEILGTAKHDKFKEISAIIK
ncbi:MAG: hydrolase [Dehalococcoidales bacterium]|nr:MAG: hydrolase [Dehalococcoidales bacterium]